MSRPAGRHTIGDDQRQGMLALPFFLPQKEKRKTPYPQSTVFLVDQRLPNPNYLYR